MRQSPVVCSGIGWSRALGCISRVPLRRRRHCPHHRYLRRCRGHWSHVRRMRHGDGVSHRRGTIGQRGEGRNLPPDNREELPVDPFVRRHRPVAKVALAHGQIPQHGGVGGKNTTVTTEDA